MNNKIKDKNLSGKLLKDIHEAEKEIIQGKFATLEQERKRFKK